MYIDNDTIRRNFTYRPWSDEEVAKFRPLRIEAMNLAIKINEMVPDSPEKTLAIRDLEDAVYHMNSAISRYPQ